MIESHWSLVIHGGAGMMIRDSVDPDDDAAMRAALTIALDAGSAVLAGGGTALDAVEVAVMLLENAPQFNAGRGAVLTYEGRTELDAAIMDGRDRSAGAVAAVTATRNPVTAARAVMTQSPHVLLSGAGADAFSVDHGLAQVEPGYFVIPERRRQLEELTARGAETFDVGLKYGTVGAVARDTSGHVAAATSTGGITGKRWGRIGDSPLIGAGTYADDRACAVSATGSGEYFIRLGVAHEICARVRLAGEAPQVAMATVLAELGAIGGVGGVIVAGAGGEAVWAFNTPGMFRGRATAAGLREVAIYGDE